MSSSYATSSHQRRQYESQPMDELYSTPRQRVRPQSNRDRSKQTEPIPTISQKRRPSTGTQPRRTRASSSLQSGSMNDSSSPQAVAPRFRSSTSLSNRGQPQSAHPRRKRTINLSKLETEEDFFEAIEEFERRKEKSLASHEFAKASAAENAIKVLKEEINKSRLISLEDVHKRRVAKIHNSFQQSLDLLDDQWAENFRMHSQAARQLRERLAWEEQSEIAKIQSGKTGAKSQFHPSTSLVEVKGRLDAAIRARDYSHADICKRDYDELLRFEQSEFEAMSNASIDTQLERCRDKYAKKRLQLEERIKKDKSAMIATQNKSYQEMEHRRDLLIQSEGEAYHSEKQRQKKTQI
ncbi:hypothetical protein BLNAU_13765 [Blattamonas nauphoetae]|uniref:Uncharacterized protein n=1 Tax=Blattamonas nauphoetae TaxID=2049346 RepID=A0ABQ9XFM7_9EUKA|nr:hypothetical protein BLNAU_13765 [Blattamonas nauphoetae]